jgi:hypothetical protein
MPCITLAQTLTACWRVIHWWRLPDGAAMVIHNLSHSMTEIAMFSFDSHSILRHVADLLIWLLPLLNMVVILSSRFQYVTKASATLSSFIPTSLIYAFSFNWPTYQSLADRYRKWFTTNKCIIDYQIFPSLPVIFTKVAGLLLHFTNCGWCSLHLETPPPGQDSTISYIEVYTGIYRYECFHTDLYWYWYIPIYTKQAWYVPVYTVSKKWWVFNR